MAHLETGVDIVWQSLWSLSTANISVGIQSPAIEGSESVSAYELYFPVIEHGFI